jgi:hypothetical protein
MFNIWIIVGFLVIWFVALKKNITYKQLKAYFLFFLITASNANLLASSITTPGTITKSVKSSPETNEEIGDNVKKLNYEPILKNALSEIGCSEESFTTKFVCGLEGIALVLVLWFGIAIPSYVIRMNLKREEVLKLIAQLDEKINPEISANDLATQLNYIFSAQNNLKEILVEMSKNENLILELARDDMLKVFNDTNTMLKEIYENVEAKSWSSVAKKSLNFGRDAIETLVAAGKKVAVEKVNESGLMSAAASAITNPQTLVKEVMVEATKGIKKEISQADVVGAANEFKQTFRTGVKGLVANEEKKPLTERLKLLKNFLNLNKLDDVNITKGDVEVNIKGNKVKGRWDVATYNADVKKALGELDKLIIQVEDNKQVFAQSFLKAMKDIVNPTKYFTFTSEQKLDLTSADTLTILEAYHNETSTSITEKASKPLKNNLKALKEIVDKLDEQLAASNTSSAAKKPEVLQDLKNLFNSEVFYERFIKSENLKVLENIRSYLASYADQFLKSDKYPLDLFDGLSSEKINQLNKLNIGPKMLVEKMLENALKIDNKQRADNLVKRFELIPKISSGIEEDFLEEQATKAINSKFIDALSKIDLTKSRNITGYLEIYVPIVSALHELTPNKKFLGDFTDINDVKKNLRNLFALANELKKQDKLIPEEEKNLADMLIEINKLNDNKKPKNMWQQDSVKEFVESLKGTDLILDYIANPDQTLKKVEEQKTSNIYQDITVRDEKLTEILKLVRDNPAKSDAVRKLLSDSVRQNLPKDLGIEGRLERLARASTEARGATATMPKFNSQKRNVQAKVLELGL